MADTPVHFMEGLMRRSARAEVLKGLRGRKTQKVEERS
jgi:hypothetical protein